jgi:hypothetical protein
LSHIGRGVLGASDLQPGVQGLSGSDVGVIGFSGLSGPTIPHPVTIAGVWGSSNELHGEIKLSSAMSSTATGRVTVEIGGSTPCTCLCTGRYVAEHGPGAGACASHER